MTNIKPYERVGIAITEPQAKAFTLDPIVVRAAVEAFRVEGLCPHCGDVTSDFLSLKTWRDFELPQPAAQKPKPQGEAANEMNLGLVALPRLKATLTVECDCNRAHESGKKGCGRVWALKVSSREDGSDPRTDGAGPAPSLFEADLAALNQSQYETQLTSARAMAKNWRGAVAALTALIAGIGFIQGPDFLAKVAENYRDDIGRWRFAALALAGVATLVGLAAEFDWPSPKEAPTSQAEYLQRLAEGRRDITDKIRLAIGSAAVAVIFVAIATWITWYHPAPEPVSPKLVKGQAVRVEDPDTARPQAFCGSLIEARNEELRVGPDRASAIPYRLETAQFSLTNKC